MESTLYNEAIKKNYFDSGRISPQTVQTYGRIFLHTAPLENKYQKDLNLFTLEEMEEVLRGFHSRHRNTIESYARIISSYLHWSVKQGYAKINVLQLLGPEDFSRYVWEHEAYMTKDDVVRAENRCRNLQDAVILRLLFVGVNGKKLSEIRNLKQEDVDHTNQTLFLTNALKEDERGRPIKFTNRVLSVDKDTLVMLEQAFGETIYYKRDSKLSGVNNVREYNELAVNPYIVRPSLTAAESVSDPSNVHVIYRRMRRIQLEQGLPFLTAKYVQRAAQIYYAHTIIDQEELTLDDIKMVASRFKISSYHNLKGFLNRDNISKTYPFSQET
ncbi:tyrosine-type recombinase/integrase [Fictibacillus sp. S7]|uniref:tyrosine-type recombinase/integrase n=1 Tax=Fictibacillus sp. S7 TaxID=2212476 RepID=UPI001012CE1A|nr:site-specific integrase [Fictibacillus sp. S7]RXY99178.1 hypothetical protein DMO16_05595 [Fictibacillus sp. S7]